MTNETQKFFIGKKKKNIELIENKIYEVDNLIKKFFAKGLKLGEMEIEDLSRDDFASLVFYILSKDRLYLKLYINLVKYFLNRYTKYGNFKGDKEYFFKKLSLSMKAERFPKDHIIFHKDDLGDKFYIILRGSVSIIIVQENYTYLTHEEYNRYLERLKYYKEYELIRLVFSYANTIKVDQDLMKAIHDDVLIDENENENSTPNNISKKKLPKYIENCGRVSAYEFVERIQPIVDYTVIEGRIKCQIATYKIVATLNDGDTFGEIALSKNEKDERKRTATIITERECLFGTVLNNVYSSFLKEVEEKSRLILIGQALQHTLFKEVSIENFLKYNYFNFFNVLTYKNGQYLFQQGEVRNSIFFINDGIVDLYTESSFQNISNFIDYLKNSMNLNNKNQSKNNDKQIDDDYFMNKEFEIQKQLNSFFYKYYTKRRTIEIYNIFKKETLGYEDFLFNNRFLFTAKVISKTCQVFVLEINLLPSLLKDHIIRKNFKITNNERKEIMIKRLKEIKNTSLNKYLENYRVLLSVMDLTKQKIKKRRNINVLRNSNKVISKTEKDNKDRVKKEHRYGLLTEEKLFSSKVRRKSNKANTFVSTFSLKNKNESENLEKKLKNKNFCIQNEDEMEKYLDRINRNKIRTKSGIITKYKKDGSNTEQIKLPTLSKAKSKSKNKKIEKTFFKTQEEVKSVKKYYNLIPKMKDLSNKLMINEYRNRPKIDTNMTQFDFLFYDHFFTERSNKNYCKSPLFLEK
jgi:CRP-like cAMP-binding protein